MLCVELPQMQYIDWSELIHIWKLSKLLWQVNTKPIDNFFVCVSLFPEIIEPPSTEVKNTKIMWTFFRDKILCPLNGSVPWTEVSQRRGTTAFKKGA